MNKKSTEILISNNTYKIQVGKVRCHFHDRKHKDTDCHIDQAVVHVLIGYRLLILYCDEPLQELVSLLHLVC